MRAKFLKTPERMRGPLVVLCLWAGVLGLGVWLLVLSGCAAPGMTRSVGFGAWQENPNTVATQLIVPGVLSWTQPKELHIDRLEASYSPGGDVIIEIIGLTSANEASTLAQGIRERDLATERVRALEYLPDIAPGVLEMLRGGGDLD